MSAPRLTSTQRVELLRAFVATHGITLYDCQQVFRARPDEQPYIDHAAASCAMDDDVEIADPPVTSESDDGSWVLAWIWASAREIWTGPVDGEGEPCRTLNHYVCEPCGVYWTDQWSCACDDRCPSCDQEIAPHDSTTLDITGKVEPAPAAVEGAP